MSDNQSADSSITGVDQNERYFHKGLWTKASISIKLFVAMGTMTCRDRSGIHIAKQGRFFRNYFDCIMCSIILILFKIYVNTSLDI